MLDKCVFKLLRDFAAEEFFSYESFNARKKKNWVPTSYVTEEYKIRRRVFFVQWVAQINKAENYLYNESPTRANEVREIQGRRWVHQGWSNASMESVWKSGRDKKETKESL